MKKIVLIAFTGILSVGVYAQQTSSAVTTQPIGSTQIVDKPVVPDFLEIKELVYDFGKIPQGKPVTHIFMVKNIGNQPLKIANVQASCGCTTPVWDRDNALVAGKESPITVGYNAASEGPFSKQITISYNETQTKVLTIKGEVWKTPAASVPENNNLKDLQ